MEIRDSEMSLVFFILISGKAIRKNHSIYITYSCSSVSSSTDSDSFAKPSLIKSDSLLILLVHVLMLV